MWKVQSPVELIQDVYPACLSGVKDPAQKARLKNATAIVFALSQAFESAITSSKVHTLQPSHYLHGTAIKNDLTQLYKKYFSTAGTPGRDFYNRIRVASPWCWACGHQRVKTLDHYLPKSKFPALSVTPLNLTPMCKDCNEAKSVAVAATPEATFIHPYFDDFEANIWLGATVALTPEPHIAFKVVGPWSKVTFERLEHHVHKFRLRELYGVESARLVAQYRQLLEREWKAGGPDQVRTVALEQQGTLRAHRLNSWQAAAWDAFAASRWFCDRGYLEFTD